MSEIKMLEDRIKDQIMKLEAIKEEYREFSRRYEGYIERINGIDLQIEVLADMVNNKDTSKTWEKNLERDKYEAEWGQ